jgi:hypothetical protein
MAIHKSMYPSWVTPKHTSHLYHRHKQDQPVLLLSRGPGPYSNLESKPPTPEARPQCSAQTFTHNPPLKVGLKRAETHDKRVTSLPAPISKYVLRIISLWPDYHPQQRTVLNRHRRDKCNQSLAQLSTRSKSKI